MEMREAKDEERLICPVCERRPRPSQSKVWDSTLPSGEKVIYGIVERHYALKGYPCEGEGFVGRSVSKEGVGGAQ